MPEQTEMIRIEGLRKVYGSGAKWKLIYEANSANVSDPNLIFVGQTLYIP